MSTKSNKQMQCNKMYMHVTRQLRDNRPLYTIGQNNQKWVSPYLAIPKTGNNHFWLFPLTWLCIDLLYVVLYAIVTIILLYIPFWKVDHRPYTYRALYQRLRLSCLARFYFLLDIAYKTFFVLLPRLWRWKCSIFFFLRKKKINT